MPISAILGAQWGDEGKGKLVDLLAGRYAAVARFNGGANAGHTIVVDGERFALHLIPCGILCADKVNLIGNGTVLHVPSLFDEIDSLQRKGVDCSPERLKISNRAHLLFDFHKEIDAQEELLRKGSSLGTTKRGIGPCYSLKAARNSLRMGDLAGDWSTFTTQYHTLVDTAKRLYNIDYDEKASTELTLLWTFRKRLTPYIIDMVVELSNMLKANQHILAEGANAALLDLDFGTYPYVTSSTTTAGGACTGLGVPPRAIHHTIGVVKAYTTRVGSGPFPTELLDEIGQRLCQVGHEYGTTTGRARRCGWLDIPLMKFSHCINGYDVLNLTKLDVLTGFKEIKIGTHYLIDGVPLPDGYMPSTMNELATVQVQYETMPGWNDSLTAVRTREHLPKAAQAYLDRVQELLTIPIAYIGVGPGRSDMILDESILDPTGAISSQ